MISVNRRRARAFTLVELLVVIGIIAILIGILLPVMGRVRAQGRTVACQANIRSILQSFFIYAADNKGSLPYGFIWNRMVLQPGGGRTGNSTDPAGSAFSFNWASMSAKIMNPKANSGGMLSAFGFPLVFKCPEGITQTEFVQPVHYAVQSVALPNVQYEIQGYPFSGDKEDASKDLIKPARLTDLFPDSALIWDTSLILSFQNWVAINEADKQLGPSFSYIDFGTLCYPGQPELRYRNSDDPYRGAVGMQWGEPIFFASPVTRPDLLPNQDTTSNQFAPDSITISNVHVGNARWRHNGGNVCNVGFADGVVRPLQWFPKRFLKGDTSKQSVDNEFLRKYIMIKWPKNKHPSWEN